MKKVILMAVVVLAWMSVQAAETKIWQAPVLSKTASAQTRNIPIVDYGGNYVRYHHGQWFLLDFIQIEKGLDLDGDGENDDSISFVPYQMDEHPPKPSRRSNWHLEVASGKLYVARTMHALDCSEVTLTEGGGPNPAHSLMNDDLNMMGWSKSNPDSKFRGYGLWMWKKEDFLGSGDSNRVGFDENSRLAVHLPRYWQNVDGSKFVVLDADASGREQWYISEYTGNGGNGANHTVCPTETKWAKYNPKDIRFPIEDAKWEEHTFKDVQAVGYI